MPKTLLAHLNFVRLGGRQNYLGDCNSNTILSLRARTCMLITQLVLHVKLEHTVPEIHQIVQIVQKVKPL